MPIPVETSNGLICCVDASLRSTEALVYAPKVASNHHLVGQRRLPLFSAPSTAQQSLSKEEKGTPERATLRKVVARVHECGRRPG